MEDNIMFMDKLLKERYDIKNRLLFMVYPFVVYMLSLFVKVFVSYEYTINKLAINFLDFRFYQIFSRAISHMSDEHFINNSIMLLVSAVVIASAVLFIRHIITFISMVLVPLTSVFVMWFVWYRDIPCEYILGSSDISYYYFGITMIALYIRFTIMTMPDFYDCPKPYREVLVQKFIKRYTTITTIVPLYLIFIFGLYIWFAYSAYLVSAIAHLINLSLGALFGFYWLMPTPMQYFRCAVRLHQNPPKNLISRVYWGR